VRPWNGSPGTRVEVKHLFYNTPVRRKFLRTVATEVGHVCEAVTRLALASPGLHVVLRHNGKLVYEIPASAGLLDRITLFFGAEVANSLYQIETGAGPVRLRGYVADPSCDKGTAKLQYLFVNGRWVRDRSLGHAVQEGYRGLLMTGRYAVAFLYLDLPPDAVDVNVHPTKSEVRFRDGQMLYHLVLAAVRDRLRRASLTPRLQAPKEPGIGYRVSGIGEEPAAGTDQRVTSLPTATYAAEATPIPDPGPASQEHPAPNAPHPIPDTRYPIPESKAVQMHDAYLIVET